MLAAIALFIIPVLMMILRHKVQDISKAGIFGLIGEYAFTVFEDSFCTLFVTRYFIVKEPIGIEAFSSVQFFLKYCALSVALGALLVFAEKFLKTHIPENWPQSVKFYHKISIVSSAVKTKSDLLEMI